uniref:Uncharacterized protein n=1 Tax=Setaria digitata TaxID=48799 RepID=A0A915PZS5_9BILA
MSSWLTFFRLGKIGEEERKESVKSSALPLNVSILQELDEEQQAHIREVFRRAQQSEKEARVVLNTKRLSRLCDAKFRGTIDENEEFFTVRNETIVQMDSLPESTDLFVFVHNFRNYCEFYKTSAEANPHHFLEAIEVTEASNPSSTMNQSCLESLVSDSKNTKDSSSEYSGNLTQKIRRLSRQLYRWMSSLDDDGGDILTSARKLVRFSTPLTIERNTAFVEYVSKLSHEICTLAIADSVCKNILDQYCQWLCTVVFTAVYNELKLKYGTDAEVDKYCFELTINIFKCVYMNAMDLFRDREQDTTYFENDYMIKNDLPHASFESFKKSISCECIQSLAHLIDEKSMFCRRSEADDDSAEEFCYVLLEEDKEKLSQELTSVLQNFAEELWIHILALVLADVILKKQGSTLQRQFHGNNLIPSIKNIQEANSDSFSSADNCSVLDESSCSVSSDEFRNEYTLLDNEEQGIHLYMKQQVDGKMSPPLILYEVDLTQDIYSDSSSIEIYENKQQSRPVSRENSGLEGSETEWNIRQQFNPESSYSEDCYAVTPNSTEIEQLNMGGEGGNIEVMNYIEQIIRKAECNMSDQTISKTTWEAFDKEVNRGSLECGMEQWFYGTNSKSEVKLEHHMQTNLIYADSECGCGKLQSKDDVLNKNMEEIDEEKNLLFGEKQTSPHSEAFLHLSTKIVSNEEKESFRSPIFSPKRIGVSKELSRDMRLELPRSSTEDYSLSDHSRLMLKTKLQSSRDNSAWRFYDLKDGRTKSCDESNELHKTEGAAAKFGFDEAEKLHGDESKVLNRKGELNLTSVVKLGEMYLETVKNESMDYQLLQSKNEYEVMKCDDFNREREGQDDQNFSSYQTQQQRKNSCTVSDALESFAERETEDINKMLGKVKFAVRLKMDTSEALIKNVQAHATDNIRSVKNSYAEFADRITLAGEPSIPSSLRNKNSVAAVASTSQQLFPPVKNFEVLNKELGKNSGEIESTSKEHGLISTTRKKNENEGHNAASEIYTNQNLGKSILNEEQQESGGRQKSDYRTIPGSDAYISSDDEHINNSSDFYVNDIEDIYFPEFKETEMVKNETKSNSSVGEVSSPEQKTQFLRRKPGMKNFQEKSNLNISLENPTNTKTQEVSPSDTMNINGAEEHITIGELKGIIYSKEHFHEKKIHTEKNTSPYPKKMQESISHLPEKKINDLPPLNRKLITDVETITQKDMIEKKANIKITESLMELEQIDCIRKLSEGKYYVQDVHHCNRHSIPSYLQNEDKSTKDKQDRNKKASCSEAEQFREIGNNARQMVGDKTIVSWKNAPKKSAASNSNRFDNIRKNLQSLTIGGEQIISEKLEMEPIEKLAEKAIDTGRNAICEEPEFELTQDELEHIARISTMAEEAFGKPQPSESSIRKLSSEKSRAKFEHENLDYAEHIAEEESQSEIFSEQEHSVASSATSGPDEIASSADDILSQVKTTEKTLAMEMDEMQANSNENMLPLLENMAQMNDIKLIDDDTTFRTRNVVSEMNLIPAEEMILTKFDNSTDGIISLSDDVANRYDTIDDVSVVEKPPSNNILSISDDKVILDDTISAEKIPSIEDTAYTDEIVVADNMTSIRSSISSLKNVAFISATSPYSESYAEKAEELFLVDSIKKFDSRNELEPIEKVKFEHENLDYAEHIAEEESQSEIFS